MRDLFDDGIFAVDGDKWRHQWKLASYEFSAKVLRDFNSAVFWANAVKLVSKIAVAATALKSIDLQGGREDILSKFLLESEKDPQNMTDQYLRDITLNFIISGKDTSTNTLAWFFYLLRKHPVVQEKVVQEVREAAGTEERIFADEFSKFITEEDLDEKQYLHASLTETLRLYPTVPLDGKTAQDDEILPEGFNVKKGDGITYMAYEMGRMTNIWGDDAAEFRPERWLHDGVFRSENPFKFTAFHAGYLAFALGGNLLKGRRRYWLLFCFTC